MDNIEKEMTAMAEKMEKSVQTAEFTKEMLQATVLRLGAEGLRKAMPRLTDVQKTMLNEVLEDMKKSHRETIARDKAATTEPKSNSTPAGDYLQNEDVKPPYTEHDETLNEEARKRGQMVHRNQGGNNAPEGWEGQVIKSEGVKEPEEKNEQKKKEDKAELDSHKDKSPAEKKFDAELSKAGEEAFGGDGDRIMKCSHGHDLKKCGECMKKSEEDKPEEKEMNLDEKKKAAKTNLPKMIGRMQERKMEKAACVTKLAKALGVGEGKIGEIWDHLAKGASEHQGPKEDNFKYDDGKTGTAPAEAAAQSPVPTQMKKGEDAGVKDSDSPDTPAYKDKAAKKVGGGAKPESGRATETADETISKVPDTMGHKGDMKKSDYWHEETSVYLAKSTNPFAHRTTGQNVAYKVDEYVEAEHIEHKERLAKSTFDYLSEGEEHLAKGGSGSGRKKESLVTGPLDYKNRDTKVGNLFGKDMEKADPEAEAAEQAKEVNRQSAQAAKDEKEAQRQAQVDEKLTRIEERSGPKIAPQLRKDWDGANAAEGMMKMKKSFINDLLEKGLDLGDDQAITAQANRAAKNSGAFLVKSFADDEMDALFKTQDMWKKDEK